MTGKHSKPHKRQVVRKGRTARTRRFAAAKGVVSMLMALLLCVNLSPAGLMATAFGEGPAAGAAADVASGGDAANATSGDVGSEAAAENRSDNEADGGASSSDEAAAGTVESAPKAKRAAPLKAASRKAAAALDKPWRVELTNTSNHTGGDFATLKEAVAGLNAWEGITITLLCDVTLDETVALDFAAGGTPVVKSGEGGPFTVTRGASVSGALFTTSGSQVRFEDIVIDGGCADSSVKVNGPLVDVKSTNPSFTLGKGAVLQNSSSNENGGAVTVGEGASFVMEDGSKIQDCSTGKDGGGVYLGLRASIAMKSGSAIERCMATGNGGAICYDNNTSNNQTVVTLENGSLITECSATKGGGIYIADETQYSSCKLDVQEGARITKCSAEYGGGAYADDYSQVAVASADSFEGNTATKAGVDIAAAKTVAVSGDGADEAVEKLPGEPSEYVCQIIQNNNYVEKYTTFAAAVQAAINRKGTLSIELINPVVEVSAAISAQIPSGCDFTVKTASETPVYGAVAYTGARNKGDHGACLKFTGAGVLFTLYGGTIRFQDVEIDGDGKASTAYGRIVNASLATTASRSHAAYFGVNTYVHDCIAPYGPVFYSTQSYVTFQAEQAVFSNCKATTSGGVAYIAGANVAPNISNCTFESCTASTYGGAICKTGTGTVTVSGSSFSNCTANSGGAVYKDGNSGVAVSNSKFAKCKAATGDGGAIRTATGGSITAGCSFTACTASAGGGGVFSSGTLTFADSSVTGCEAKDGGGMYMYGTNDVSLSGNVTVDGNSTGINMTGTHMQVAGDLTGGDVWVYDRDAGNQDAGENFATGNSYNGIDKLKNDLKDWLYGVKGTGNYIKWADIGDPSVCRVSQPDGTWKEYTNLKTAMETDADTQTNDVTVEMLVPTYTTTGYIDMDTNRSHTVTLTTKPDLTDSEGNAVSAATVKWRGTGIHQFYLYNKDMVFKNITIDGGGNSGQNGAFLKVYSGNHKVTLDAGTTVRNFKCSTHGGALDLAVANTEAIMNSGSVIENCTTSSTGGAINLHNETGCKVTMNGGIIRNCYTTANAGYGGAISLNGTGGSVEMSNGAKIENCRTSGTTGHGGAVYMAAGATFTMKDSSILNCNTIGYDNVSGSGGQGGASASAGALYVVSTNANKSTVSITDSTISGCKTKNSGGAFFITGPGGTATLDGATITGCEAANGGVFGIGENGEVTLKGACSMTGNTAAQNGSVMNATSGTLEIQDTVSIKDNTAATAGETYSGGALYNSGATIEVSGAPTIRDNNNEEFASGTSQERNVFLVNTSTTNAGADTYYDRLTVVGDLTGGDIGVYCDDTTSAAANAAARYGKTFEKIRYKYKDQFGSVPASMERSYNVLGLQHLTNDRTSEAKNLKTPASGSATKRLVGIAGSGTQVVWGWVCQIVKDGQFQQVYGSLKDAVDETNSIFTGTTRIEMLIPEYMMEREAAFTTAGNDVTVTTAPATEQGGGYAFQNFGDSVSIAKVVKGTNGTMLTQKISKLTFTNVVFDGHKKLVHTKSFGEQVQTGTTEGGIVKVDSGELDLAQGCVFQNSKVAAADGGAVAAAKDTTVKLSGNAQIVNCEAQNGGAIRMRGPSILELADAAVIGKQDAGNAAVNDGGGIYASDTGGTVTIGGNASVAYNTAGGKGGALDAGKNYTVEVKGGASVVHNKATGNGGGINVGDGTKVTLDANGGSAKIESCESGSKGGGVYLGKSAELDITGGAHIQSCAAKDGGGVATSDSCTVRMTGQAHIVSCTATSNGGGICADKGSSVTMDGPIDNDMRIYSCSAAKGGGVYLGSTAAAASSLTLKGGACISSCVATGSGGQGGGAYLKERATMTLDGTGATREKSDGSKQGANVSNCAAANGKGGGVYADGAAVRLENGAEISNNGTHGTSTTMDGGGVYLNGAGQLSMDATTRIAGNDAANGAGVYFGGSAPAQATFAEGASLSTNTATGNGGGIYLANAVNITDNGLSIGKNAAANGGGVYAASGAAACFSAAEIGSADNGNTATDGAGIYAASGQLTLADSASVAHNTASGNGGGIYVASGSTVQLMGTKVEANSAGTSSYGAGAYLAVSGKLKVQGDVVVTGNGSGTDGLAGTGNLYLANTSASDIGELVVTGNLGDAANILVYAASAAHDGYGTNGPPDSTEQFGVSAEGVRASELGGLSHFVSEVAQGHGVSVTGQADGDTRVVWGSTVFLQVTKRVSGDYADLTKPFNFTVQGVDGAQFKLYTANPSTSSASPDKTASATATLSSSPARHDAEGTTPAYWEKGSFWLEMDPGASVTITETDADGYTVTAMLDATTLGDQSATASHGTASFAGNAATVTLASGAKAAPAQLVFTNTMPEALLTGLADNLLLWVGLAALAAAGIALLGVLAARARRTRRA